MSSLMRHWRGFCLLLCCCSVSDHLWHREKTQWLRERRAKNSLIYWTINFSLLNLGIVTHISSSHDAKYDSVIEYDICLFRRPHCAVVSGNVGISIPADTVIVLCCHRSNYRFSKLCTLWFFSLSFFCPPRTPPGCVTVPLSVVFTGLVVTKHLPGIWCTAWVFAATNHIPAGLKIN